MNNWKEYRIYKENVRGIQDTLQRAREQVSRINREQEHREFNRIVGIGTAELPYSYDSDIFEYEFQRLKAKETPMLVDCSNFTYKEFANGKLYFCPKCCNMIIKSYFYCPTCGQHLLWAYINNIRATTEDGENADRKD